MRIREEAVPERSFGFYLVVGNREYRGHKPGTTFTASLERNAERRAVVRGDITLLQRIVPELEAESFTFPEGWLPQPQSVNPRRREAPQSLGGR